MKINQLEEAIRFGGREINALKKMSRDILVSFEYEFNVTREIGDEDEQESAVPFDELEMVDIIEHPQYQEMENAEVEEMLDDFRREVEKTFEPDTMFEYADDFVTKVSRRMGEEPSISVLSGRVDDLIDLYKDEGSVLRSDKGRKLLNDVYEILLYINVSDVFTDISIAAEDAYNVGNDNGFDVPMTFTEAENPYQDIFNDLFSLFDGLGWFKYSRSEEYHPDQLQFDFLINNYEEELEDAMERLSEEWGTVLEAFDMVGRILSEFEEAKEEFYREVEMAGMDRADSISHDFLMDEFRRWYEENEQTGNLISVRQKISYISRLIQEGQFGVRGEMIEDVMSDVSVPNGVEVTFVPMPLEDALDNMDSMFKLIDAVGNTADNTGLHVNISFKDQRFNRANLSPTRLYLLMDERYIRKVFGVRNHVNDMVPEGMVHLWGAVTHYKNNGFTALRNWTDGLIDDSQKYQTVNFQHLQREFRREGRIEFRAPGGKNYHLRGDEIRQSVYRMAHLIKVAFDPNFDEKNFNEALFKFWDRMAKRVNAKYGHGNVGFADMVSYSRKTGEHFDASGTVATDPKDFINKMGI